MTARYNPRSVLTADGEAVRVQLAREIALVGWSETARRSGVERTALHRVFGPMRATRSPNFATVAAVAEALGLQLTISRKPAP